MEILIIVKIKKSQEFADKRLHRKVIYWNCFLLIIQKKALILKTFTIKIIDFHSFL